MVPETLTTMWVRLVRSHLPQPTTRTIAWALPKFATWAAESLGARPGDTLETLRHKNAKLRAVLKTTQWPRLLRFHGSDGEAYELPLRSQKTCPSPPPLPADADDILQYLGGFFDGDGCVAGYLAHCRLVVGQSFDKAEILILFQATFGGSISRHRAGTGLRKPMIKWEISGQACRRAARLLAPYSLTKQRQLLLAADWPEHAFGRQQFVVELSRLKRHDSAVVGPCSVRYLAGFFDAEGNILPRHYISIRLRMVQKFRTVLDCLLRFLMQDLGIQATLTKERECFCLNVHGTSRAKQALHSMLSAGMLGKAKQAKLALTLTPENEAQVHADLAEMVGNQSFGKKLDEAGRARARGIASLKARKAVMDPRQMRELEMLKLEHDTSTAQRENQLLLEYKQKIETLRGELWEVGN